MPPCKVCFSLLDTLSESLVTQSSPCFCRFHLDDYWMFASRMVSPQLHWQIGPLHLVGFHPMSVILANRKFSNWCCPLLPTFCQCVSTCPAVNCEVWPESHKTGSYSPCHQEWDSGTFACDYHHLLFSKSLFVFALDLLVILFSPFDLLNVWPFGGSSPTSIINSKTMTFPTSPASLAPSMWRSSNSKGWLLPSLRYVVHALNLCKSLPTNWQRIPSKVSTIWDGWSTRKQWPFTSFSISFIDLPPDNDTLWVLKKYLLKFNSPVGRHTGELIGMDLVNTIRNFQLEKKVSTEDFVIINYF